MKYIIFNKLHAESCLRSCIYLGNGYKCNVAAENCKIGGRRGSEGTARVGTDYQLDQARNKSKCI